MDRLQARSGAHSHVDHIRDIPYIAQQTGAHVYGSESTLNVGRGGYLAEDLLTLDEPGTALAFGCFTITVLVSKHSPPAPANDDIGKTID